METYYTIYKITNQVNGKIYIGCHKTKDLDDNYMGSGKYLKHSQEKHGLENFTKEILHVFDNPEDMFKKEAELVTEEFIAEENTYNLRIGGLGGFDYINSERKNLYGKNGQAGFGLENLIRGNQLINHLKQNGKYEDWKQKISESNKGKQTFLGKKHSEETKKKIGQKSSVSQSGQGNSQYGTMWITNGTESKKIKKSDILPDGWQKGRKIK